MDTRVPTSPAASTQAAVHADAASVVWFEVMGQDQARLRAFFSELFNWRFTSTQPTYSVIPEPAKGIPGAVGTSPEGHSWTTFYVQVKDLEASLRRAVELGGTQLTPVTQLPGCVRFAVFADPEGHPIGLVQPPEAA